MEVINIVTGWWLREKLRSERGASVVEYVFLLVLIVVVLLVAVQAFGTGVSSHFDRVSGSINAV